MTICVKWLIITIWLLKGFAGITIVDITAGQENWCIKEIELRTLYPLYTIPYHFVYLAMCMKYNHICIYTRICTCNLLIEALNWNPYYSAYKIFYFNNVLYSYKCSAIWKTDG